MAWVVGLNRMVKESLTMKMTFGKDVKEVGELAMAAIRGKSVLGRRNSKNHKAGMYLECSREDHEAGVG